ncbi:MAG: FtsH protease activity modulator HflK [Parvularculaceae bacterium]|nr:FtsH protease activity modulator HflK [Parvularculaceae bacterium]
MPWSDNSGNKGSSGGPWGQSPRPPGGGGSNNGGGGNRGPEPPDLEDLLKASSQRLKRAFPRGPGGGGRAGGPMGGEPIKLNRNTMLAAGGLFVGVWLLSGFYTVAADELAVVTTVGKFDRVSPSGLHWRLPYPFQSVRKERVTTSRTNQVPTGENAGLMLTRDKNIVDAAMTVQWQIKNEVVAEKPGQFPAVAAFMFNVQDPTALVEMVGEASLREVIGRNDLDDVQTTGRAKVQEDTRTLMQASLDAYQSGILINEVNLGKVDPPTDAVNAAFLDVNAAAQDRDRDVNSARAYENRKVAEAVGEARQKLELAKGYAARVTADARGQASRFDSIYAEYQRAPEVTRQRMYLETVERVLGPMNKVIIDDQGRGGVVPYLPLNDLQRRAPQQQQQPSTQGR